MKTIIAGSRSFTDKAAAYELLYDKVPWLITQVISGGAVGADRIGEEWAWDNILRLHKFIPDWSKFGLGAGYQRNIRMANEAEALVAFWKDESCGTAHMINTAKKMGLRVVVFLV